jgi:hypothetical protein
MDYSGWSVSTAGDVNGDDLDDLIVSAYGADSRYVDCCAVNFTEDDIGFTYLFFIV